MFNLKAILFGVGAILTTQTGFAKMLDAASAEKNLQTCIFQINSHLHKLSISIPQDLNYTIDPDDNSTVYFHGMGYTIDFGNIDAGMRLTPINKTCKNGILQ